MAQHLQRSRCRATANYRVNWPRGGFSDKKAINVSTNAHKEFLGARKYHPAWD